ncbi:MAG: hypothetical protein PUH63_01075, partial [Firmicutes bacterium]|nr:hypothetical protein [Bacillota bacterium]
QIVAFDISQLNVDHLRKRKKRTAICGPPDNNRSTWQDRQQCPGLSAQSLPELPPKKKKVGKKQVRKVQRKSVRKKKEKMGVRQKTKLDRVH